MLNIAFGERERAAVIQMTGGAFRPAEVYVGYETSTFKNVISFYENNVLFPFRPKRRFVQMSEPFENLIHILNQDRPDVLTGYGGWIHLFLKTMIARRIPFHLPKMIMYMGEALPPGGRDFIEKDLGVPLLSRYNSIESFKIGFYCEKRTGFHLHEDLCHVRITGPNGETLPPGEQGQIVISNLVNRGSVILNYAIGDLAAISLNGCSCGRSSRILSELEGRVEDILPLPDGSFIHPRMIWKVFKNQPDLIQYQLTQHEPKRFELKIAAKDEEAYQRILLDALPELHNLLGSDAYIETAWRNEFPRESGQKFRAVASRVST